MALIKCPDCGKDVSSKAVKCPHCGKMMSGKTCPECGTVVDEKEKACPTCGYPFGKTKKEKSKKSGKKIVGKLIAILIPLVLVAGLALVYINVFTASGTARIVAKSDIIHDLKIEDKFSLYGLEYQMEKMPSKSEKIYDWASKEYGEYVYDWETFCKAIKGDRTNNLNADYDGFSVEAKIDRETELTKKKFLAEMDMTESEYSAIGANLKDIKAYKKVIVDVRLESKKGERIGNYTYTLYLTRQNAPFSIWQVIEYEVEMNRGDEKYQPGIMLDASRNNTDTVNSLYELSEIVG